MVGPISAAERASFTRKLKVGVAVLVGLSGGLMALGTDASLPLAGGATLVGAAVGLALAQFVVPSGPSPAERQRQRRAAENPFEGSGEDLTDDGSETVQARERHD